MMRRWLRIMLRAAKRTAAPATTPSTPAASARPFDRRTCLRYMERSLDESFVLPAPTRARERCSRPNAVSACLDKCRLHASAGYATCLGGQRFASPEPGCGLDRKMRRSLWLSVSIGGAMLGNGLDTAAAVFDQADRCLYAAKRAGRNRVHFKVPIREAEPDMLLKAG